MSKLMDFRYMQAELSAIDGMLQRIPVTRRIERMQLEERREEVESKLAMIGPHLGRTAESVLIFGGDPVKGAIGIETAFAASALENYQDLVAKHLAAQHGPLGSSGPIPNEKDSHLHITSIVHGSFGFELSEIVDDPQLSFGPSPLAKSVDEVATLITAAGTSDEDLAEALDGVNGRVVDALNSFFGVIRKNGATFKLVHSAGEIEFDRARIQDASERCNFVHKEEDD